MSLVINSSGKLITMNKCTYLSYDVPNLFLDGKRSSVQHSMSIGYIIVVSMDTASIGINGLAFPINGPNCIEIE